jgi:hypothetical protein
MRQLWRKADADTVSDVHASAHSDILSDIHASSDQHPHCNQYAYGHADTLAITHSYA